MELLFPPIPGIMDPLNNSADVAAIVMNQEHMRWCVVKERFPEVSTCTA